MKRILIDTNVVDVIADTPGFLAAIQRAGSKGLLVFLRNHVVEDELQATSDDARRDLLVATYGALPHVEIATRGVVLGESRLDRACLGDDKTGDLLGVCPGNHV
jgi:hypothetical protein